MQLLRQRRAVACKYAVKQHFMIKTMVQVGQNLTTNKCNFQKESFWSFTSKSVGKSVKPKSWFDEYGKPMK